MAEIWTRATRQRQPTGAVAVDWNSPLLDGAEFVMVGSALFYNPTAKNVTYTGSIQLTQSRVGRVASVSRSNYLAYPQPIKSGGTGPWTIAGVYVPTALPTSWSATGTAIAGSCANPGSTTQDRSVGFAPTTNAWRGYVFDGATRYADSSAVPAVGRPDTVILTCNGLSLVCAVGGASDATVAVSNAGFNGYAAAQFCVGRPDAVSFGGATTGIAVLVRISKSWNDTLRAAFKANPWQIFTERRVTYFFPSAIPTLSAATAVSIGSTTATPRVTLTF